MKNYFQITVTFKILFTWNLCDWFISYEHY